MGGYRILVVDDHEPGARALQIGLQLFGHTVEIAGDGLEALRIAETFRPEVAVVDLGLPGMDGYELAARLRAGQAPRLIAVTGRGDASERARTRDAGFEAHVLKPVDLELLCRLIAAPATPR